jgi:AcrR family transcriptional regulator
MVSAPQRTRRRPTREATRGRVLDAAARTFAAHGFAAASLDDVAAAAGLTKGATYSSFRSKDELILALMEERVVERTKTAAAAFEEAAHTDGGIEEAGARLIEAVHADADWQQLFIEYWAHAMREPSLRVRLAARRRELRSVIARAVERAAKDRGLELGMPPEHVAVLILALSNGLAVEGLLDPEAIPAELFGRVLSRMADG